MPKAETYECPRCNYSTKIKRDMHKHLYLLKKECANIKNLELTEEIKLCVLKSKVYHKLQSELGTIQNFNILNNYVNGLETLDKLPLFLSYNSKSLMDINDKGEKLHQDAVRKLEEDRTKYPLLIESHKFLEMIDSLVGVNKNDIEEMNVIYDEELNKIKIFCDDEWECYMPDQGMKRLVQILRTNYLDKYECYLYKKIYMDKAIGPFSLNEVRLKLADYYKFLYILDHHPYVYKEKSEYVLENYRYSNPDELCSYGMSIYDEIKKNVGKTDINSFKKNILEIIKRNHKKNIKTLNENIFELINLDCEFKNKLLSQTPKGLYLK